MAVEYINQDREFVSVTIKGVESQVLYQSFVAMLAKDMYEDIWNLLHGAVGVAGEAGELLDAVKKAWAYGKELDRTNVIEELGDLEFYMQLVRLVIGVSRQEVLEANQAKLSVRYAGLVYSDDAAIARADKVHQVETFHELPQTVDETSSIETTEDQAREVKLVDGKVQAVNYDLGPDPAVGVSNERT